MTCLLALIPVVVIIGQVLSRKSRFALQMRNLQLATVAVATVFISINFGDWSAIGMALSVVVFPVTAILVSSVIAQLLSKPDRVH